MLTKFLVVWQEIPENTYLVTLELDDVDAQKLRECHMKYISGWASPEQTDFLLSKFYTDDGFAHPKTFNIKIPGGCQEIISSGLYV